MKFTIFISSVSFCQLVPRIPDGQRVVALTNSRQVQLHKTQAQVAEVNTAFGAFPCQTSKGASYIVGS